MAKKIAKKLMTRTGAQVNGNVNTGVNTNVDINEEIDEDEEDGGRARANARREAIEKVTASDPVFRQYGPPFMVDEGGKASINERAIAAKCAEKHTILFDTKLRVFMRYDADTGLWAAECESKVRRLIGDLLLELGEKCELLRFAQALKVSHFTAVAKMIQSYQVSVTTLPSSGLVHAANGVIDLRGVKPKLLPHDQGYMYTLSAGVEYDADAKCTRFEKVLLGQALENEDSLLLQKYFGSMLLGPNLTHGILIIRGTPGGGKSTLVTIIEKILGLDLVAYLRTAHLGGRFETSAFIGKRLLVGKDVGGDTLSNSGAHFLKSLVGGDQMQGEYKFNPKKFQMKGDYHVAIAANSNLNIALDGDAEAWRRRLLIVDFNRPKTTKPESNLAENLVAAEASGILNWMVAGALLCRKECAEKGHIVLTKKQEQLVTELLKDSDNMPAFIDAAVVADDDGDVTSEELLLKYREHCISHGWKQVPGSKFQTRIPDLLCKEFGVLRRHDIKRDGRPLRGYRGIRLN